MSAVSPGAFWIFSARYLPRPSCVIPRWTGTPRCGTSANLIVLFGSAQIASERSLPTFPSTTSNAAMIATRSFSSPPSGLPFVDAIRPSRMKKLLADVQDALGDRHERGRRQEVDEPLERDPRREDQPSRDHDHALGAAADPDVAAQAD